MINGMRIFPANKQGWFALLLFPFKVYLVAAPVCLFVWGIAIAKHHVRDAGVEAAGRVLLGYMFCIGVFIFAAAVQFFTGKHAAAVESLVFAAVAFFIMSLLAHMYATA